MGLDQLRTAIDAGRKQVLAHPLYSALGSEAAVVTFMEHHVWAVWDFMSLLTSLQRQLTCTTLPWVPVGLPATRRLVNEIKVAEECDEVAGSYLSHFELYLAAMYQADADSAPIEKFLALLRRGRPVLGALYESGCPGAADYFVAATFDLIENRPLHAQAAVFALTREDLIPEMFAQVTSGGPGRLELFRGYLDRHIEVDAGEHGPMALAMLAELCGDSEARWKDCEVAVAGALAARRRLWDGVVQAIEAYPGAVGGPAGVSPAGC
jgi:DUF3050 family protein